jgi:two-component system, NarL family, response regulator NreC
MNALTAKEKEVLSLISSGLTTKEIADRLGISHHTVESHRKNLLKKSQAKNSAELIQKNYEIIFQMNQVVAAG